MGDGDRIDGGLRLLKGGDLSAAAAIFSDIIAADPRNAEALHLLGLVELRRGARGKALELIDSAIAIEPGEAIFRINAASILAAENRHDEAARHLKDAANATGAADLYERLGEAELKRGDWAAALAAFEASLSRDASRAGAYAGAAFSLARVGDHKGAVDKAKEALRRNAHAVSAARIGAASAFAISNWPETEMFARVWSAAEPASADAARLRAGALFELGYAVEAARVLEPFADLEGAPVSLVADYARFCLGAQRLDDAKVAAGVAARRAPDDVSALYCLSRIALFEGDLDQSETLLRKIYINDPDFAPALTDLANLKGGAVDEGIVERLRAAGARSDLSKDRRAAAHFALGGIDARRGDFEAAFKNYSVANALSRETLHAEGRLFDASAAAGARTRIKHWAAIRPLAIDRASPVRPVFIVGMPRSGTTLVESILSAHESVSGAGELTAMVAIHERALAAADLPDEKTLWSWRNEYLGEIASRGSKPVIIDKQPLNYRSIDLIKAMLPEARVINVRRNPVETGFSIYRNDFGKAWNYATSLADIAAAYGDYARSVASWGDQNSSLVHTIQYEELIKDIEGEGAALCAFLGLDWQAAMADFHKVRRTVMTFSAAQVRSPLRGRAPTAALQYGDFLKPLVDGLIAARIDLETGAFLGDEGAA